MRADTWLRRSAVVLLIGVLLLGAVVHGGAGLPAAILIPLLFCFAAIPRFKGFRPADFVAFFSALPLVAFAPRPPPVLN